MQRLFDRNKPRLISFFSMVFCAFANVAAASDILEGEAVVTSFSGVTITLEGQAMSTELDPNGVVARSLDLRNPDVTPMGQHWVTEPQRDIVTASEVGQVWGVALSKGEAPDIYLAASSAFGVYRSPDGTAWANGQWGPEGGPETIWRLSAAKGYEPQVFARLHLAGRPEFGAALGDLAFDPYHRVLFASDLQTGFIHVLNAQTGEHVDVYDHGVDALSGFIDARTGEAVTLPVVPADVPQIEDSCAELSGQLPTDCLGYAALGRRVWGLGLRSDPDTGEHRLFYGVMGQEGGSVWSLPILETGALDRTAIRREFELRPDADAVPVFAVSDISLPERGDQSVMIVSRFRGETDAATPGFSWPGFAAQEPQFWRLDAEGLWQEQPATSIGAPLGANLAGASAFGPDISTGRADMERPQGLAWFTGNHLCADAMPCANPATGTADGVAEVHGLVGLPVPAVEAAPVEPDMTYLAIDLDRNINAEGQIDMAELTRRNPGMVGAIAVHSVIEVPDRSTLAEALPDPWMGEDPNAGAAPEGAAEDAEGAVALIRDLALEKTSTGECRGGQPCGFEIRVRNVGAQSFDGDLTIVDIAPDGWRPASPSAGWACIYSLSPGRRFSCHRPVVLLPGQSVSMPVALWVPADADGDYSSVSYDLTWFDFSESLSWHNLGGERDGQTWSCGEICGSTVERRARRVGGNDLQGHRCCISPFEGADIAESGCVGGRPWLA